MRYSSFRGHFQYDGSVMAHELGLECTEPTHVYISKSYCRTFRYLYRALLRDKVAKAMSVNKNHLVLDYQALLPPSSVSSFPHLLLSDY